MVVRAALYFPLKAGWRSLKSFYKNYSFPQSTDLALNVFDFDGADTTTLNPDGLQSLKV